MDLDMAAREMAPAPGAPPLEEIKRRVLQIVSAGGGCDMAKLAPSYKRAFGEQLDATQ